MRKSKTQSQLGAVGGIASKENYSAHSLSAISQSTGKPSTHLDVIKVKAGGRKKL